VEVGSAEPITAAAPQQMETLGVELFKQQRKFRDDQRPQPSGNCHPPDGEFNMGFRNYNSHSTAPDFVAARAIGPVKATQWAQIKGEPHA
jgi:hypothetical protein